MTPYLFIKSESKHHTKLMLLTVLLAIVVILLGAYTRLTNAGLSCPDWPHCYGYLVAPHTVTQISDAMRLYPGTPLDIKKAWTEMTHRYLAGTEGLLILGLSIAIFFMRLPKQSKAYIPACLLIIGVVVQILLGKLTVTAQLKPIIVLSHLMTGLSLLSLLWYLFLLLNAPLDFYLPSSYHYLRRFSWLALCVIALQIGLGGWVSSHYAGLACVDFPYCNGKLIPDLQWQNFNTHLITIHMAHRFGALITLFYLATLSLYLLSMPLLRKIALIMLSLLCLQVLLGIFNILWLRPVWIALLHHGVAILLLLTIVTLVIKLSSNKELRYGSYMA